MLPMPPKREGDHVAVGLLMISPMARRDPAAQQQDDDSLKPCPGPGAGDEQHARGRQAIRPWPVTRQEERLQEGQKRNERPLVRPVNAKGRGRGRRSAIGRLLPMHTKRYYRQTEKNKAGKKRCNPKMIMSYSAKVEMS